MTRVSWFILLLCTVGIVGGPWRAGAQAADDEVAIRTVGTVTNLFGSLDPSSPMVGARLRLPEGWTVEDVRLLRYGAVAVPVRHRTEADGAVLLTTERPVQAPHELVVRVRIGGRPGTYQWHLTPLYGTPRGGAQDSLGQRVPRRIDRVTRRVEVEPPSEPDGENRAVDLQAATRPLLAPLPEPLALGRGASFTVEFWLRTTGLDEVILSTWTGEEAVPYPVEFVVDPGGRLRFYCGQSGRHQALRTMAPVADDHWHHAAVVYDASASRLRLMLDGTVVDSARARAMPSSPRGRSVAVGGRLPRQAGAGEEARLYSGRLDEVRVWPEARSVGLLRRMRTQPLAPSTGGEDGGAFRLDFEAEPEDDRVDWPAGTRRVPTVLSFRSPLRNLQAQTEDQSVTLRWETDAAGEGTFVVERSPDGTSFSPIARLDPSAPTSPSQSREVVYTDRKVPEQVVYYRIRQVFPNENIERTTGTIKIGLGASPRNESAVELVGNFPNPFEESTTIAYRVHEATPLTLAVWDLSGKRITTLADGTHEPGYYEKVLSAGELPSGTYFARIRTARGVQSHRMILLK